MDHVLSLRQYNWHKSLINLQTFDIGIFKSYIGSEGSHRILKVGYSLFISAYLKDIWIADTSSVTGVTVLIKARCFAKMKKNEVPHELFFEYNVENAFILNSFCSCKAGKGKCIHLSGLAHLLNHLVLMGFKEVPDAVTCTSLEQQWHKPRGEQIEADAIMETIFARPNMKRMRDPPKCSFVTIADKTPPTYDEVVELAKKVKEHNMDFPLAYLLTPPTALVKIPIGEVPTGSTLAHQLRTFQPNQSYSTVAYPVEYPDLPLAILELPFDMIYSEGLDISLVQAIALETKTRAQNTSLWHQARKFRITSSQFSRVCKRKKKVNDLFLKSLCEGQDLSKVNSIIYGKKNESVARLAYTKHMDAIGKPVTVFSAGFVVNPGMPFLGCSPDGKVYDRLATPRYGLLEIKCPISKRLQTLEKACSDKSFYCMLVEGTLHLKETSDIYYQVQGQMFICGADWSDFVVYNGKDVWIERIQKEDVFCYLMSIDLCTFYMQYFHDYITCNTTITSTAK